MLRSIARSIPTVVVAALVVLTARAQPTRPLPWSAGVSPPEVAPARPQDAALADPPDCDPGATLSAWVTGTSGFDLVAGMSIAQGVTLTPVDAVVRAGGVVSTIVTSTLRFELRAATGTTLAPEPSIVALRAASVTVTPGTSWPSATFDPPLVVRAATGTAQGTGEHLAIVLVGPASPGPRVTLGYDADGHASSTPALLTTGGGLWNPLPGNHPLLMHTVCGPAPADALDWHAVQQVVHGDAVTSTPSLLQTFRVPVACELDWAELPLRATEFASGTIPALRIAGPRDGWPLELEGAVVATLTAESGSYATGTPAFAATGRLQQRPVLTPGVDYHLLVDTGGAFEAPTADGSADGAGALFARDDLLGPYAATDRDLAYRLIGIPVALAPAAPGVGTPTIAFAHGVSLTAVVQAEPLRRMVQPLTVSGTLAIGELRVPVGSDGDAVTLTLALRPRDPDPTFTPVALVAVTLTAETGATAWRGATFDHPIVNSAVSGTTTGLDLVIEEEVGQPGRAKVAFAVTATAELTPGYVETDGAPLPLTGTRPVIGHHANAFDDPQSWHVAQQVVATDGSVVASGTAEMVQVFRVPAPTRAAWVELAIPAGQPPAAPLEVAIVDPGEEPLPLGPIVATSTVALAHDRAMSERGSFHDTPRFADGPVLLPDRDYWLVLRDAMAWRVSGRPSSNTIELGQTYGRSGPGTPWTETGRMMLFRVIGAPPDPLDVAASSPRGFSLRATPNPFEGEMSFGWAGGAGRVRIEIFDLAGRRVRHVRDAGPASGGAWRWHGDDDAGRALRAGAYFARVTPSGGGAVSRRVVLVR